MLKHILVPLDGSRMAESALDHAVDLAKAVNGTVVVLRVVVPAPQRPPSPLPDPLLETQKQEAEEYIAAVTERLEELGVHVRSHIFIGDPAPHIIRLTEFEDCDLVVMSSHGLGGGEWHVFGSVAQKVLHSAHVPVMVVKWASDEARPAAALADEETETQE